MARLAVAALFSLAAACTASAGENPWEPSRAGKIECFGSNLAAKTCESMTVYRWLDTQTVAGEVQSYSKDVASGVVVHSSWQASIKGNTKCSVRLKSDIEANTFQRDGKPVSDAETLKFRAKLADGQTDTFGKTYCLRIGKYGREYTAQLTIDGREMPSESNWLAWVDTADGFTLSR